MIKAKHTGIFLALASIVGMIVMFLQFSESGSRCLSSGFKKSSRSNNHSVIQNACWISSDYQESGEAADDHFDLKPVLFFQSSSGKFCHVILKHTTDEYLTRSWTFSWSDLILKYQKLRL
jgi:hypothetical protein